MSEDSFPNKNQDTRDASLLCREEEGKDDHDDGVAQQQQQQQQGAEALGCTVGGSPSSFLFMNESSNVLLIYRLQELYCCAVLNFLLSIFCLAYCAVNITLIYVQYVNVNKKSSSDDYNSVDDGWEIISDKTFHLMEFWATFGFALIECASLISSPKPMSQIYFGNPNFLKVLLFMNVVIALIPALLTTINLDEFETISHELEYSNELTMSFVDLVLLVSLFQKNNKTRATAVMNDANTSVLTNISQQQQQPQQEQNQLSGWMSVVALMVALIQLAVYNLMGKDEDGDMRGEVPAHYLEFTFEIISSMIAFWFCMDNKYIANQETALILYMNAPSPTTYYHNGDESGRQGRDAVGGNNHSKSSSQAHLLV